MEVCTGGSADLLQLCRSSDIEGSVGVHRIGKVKIDLCGTTGNQGCLHRDNAIVGRSGVQRIELIFHDTLLFVVVQAVGKQRRIPLAQGLQNIVALAAKDRVSGGFDGVFIIENIGFAYADYRSVFHTDIGSNNFAFLGLAGVTQIHHVDLGNALVAILVGFIVSNTEGILRSRQPVTVVIPQHGIPVSLVSQRAGIGISIVAAGIPLVCGIGQQIHCALEFRHGHLLHLAISSIQCCDLSLVINRLPVCEIGTDAVTVYLRNRSGGTLVIVPAIAPGHRALIVCNEGMAAINGYVSHTAVDVALVCDDKAAGSSTGNLIQRIAVLNNRILGHMYRKACCLIGTGYLQIAFAVAQVVVIAHGRRNMGIIDLTRNFTGEASCAGSRNLAMSHHAVVGGAAGSVQHVAAGFADEASRSLTAADLRCTAQGHTAVNNIRFCGSLHSITCCIAVFRRDRNILQRNRHIAEIAAGANAAGHTCCLLRADNGAVFSHNHLAVGGIDAGACAQEARGLLACHSLHGHICAVQRHIFAAAQEAGHVALGVAQGSGYMHGDLALRIRRPDIGFLQVACQTAGIFCLCVHSGHGEPGFCTGQGQVLTVADQTTGILGTRFGVSECIQRTGQGQLTAGNLCMTLLGTHGTADQTAAVFCLQGNCSCTDLTVPEGTTVIACQQAGIVLCRQGDRTGDGHIHIVDRALVPSSQHCCILSSTTCGNLVKVQDQAFYAAVLADHFKHTRSVAFQLETGNRILHRLTGSIGVASTVGGIEGILGRTDGSELPVGGVPAVILGGIDIQLLDVAVIVGQEAVHIGHGLQLTCRPDVLDCGSRIRLLRIILSVCGIHMGSCRIGVNVHGVGLVVVVQYLDLNIEFAFRRLQLQEVLRQQIGLEVLVLQTEYIIGSNQTLVCNGKGLIAGSDALNAVDTEDGITILHNDIRFAILQSQTAVFGVLLVEQVVSVFITVVLLVVSHADIGGLGGPVTVVVHALQFGEGIDGTAGRGGVRMGGGGSGAFPFIGIVALIPPCVVQVFQRG